jgi:hypothetical protein
MNGWTDKRVGINLADRKTDWLSSFRQAGRQAGRQAYRLFYKYINFFAGIVQGRQERERCRLRCRGERERSTEDAICQVPTLENFVADGGTQIS